MVFANTTSWSALHLPGRRKVGRRPAHRSSPLNSRCSLMVSYGIRTSERKSDPSSVARSRRRASAVSRPERCSVCYLPQLRHRTVGDMVCTAATSGGPPTISWAALRVHGAVTPRKRRILVCRVAPGRFKIIKLPWAKPRGLERHPDGPMQVNVLFLGAVRALQLAPKDAVHMSATVSLKQRAKRDSPHHQSLQDVLVSRAGSLTTA